MSEVSKLKPSKRKLPSNVKFPPMFASPKTCKADAEIYPDAEMFPVAVMSANLTEDSVVKPEREAVKLALVESKVRSIPLCPVESATVIAEEPVIEKTPEEGSLIVMFWCVPLVKDWLNIVVMSDIDFVTALNVNVLLPSLPVISILFPAVKFKTSVEVSA